MFITQKRGLKLDGKQPVLLYGYGGFEHSLTPSFRVRNAVWLELGGVYVEANLRGGGEYGSLWHLEGTKEKKQNVFDDFIACAEWLIANGYTSPEKLAINGGSNGGLLVGACLTQRPDLFGAALPAVGVLDMLRFHKFTIGWAWTSDYGSADDPQDFKALYAYSPLHNLKPGTRYPATMISTADHDDRVVPAHSFKFAARLQECQAKGGPPVLIRIETKAGHGAGTALTKVIDETADEIAFLVKMLGMEPVGDGGAEAGQALASPRVRSSSIKLNRCATSIWSTRRRRSRSACGRAILDEYVGQSHILGPGKLLRRAIEADPTLLDHPLRSAGRWKNDARGDHRARHGIAL
jgi:prolyl oligopeptidase